jgi:hypothetical protein
VWMPSDSSRSVHGPPPQARPAGRKGFPTIRHYTCPVTDLDGRKGGPRPVRVDRPTALEDLARTRILELSHELGKRSGGDPQGGAPPDLCLRRRETVRATARGNEGGRSVGVTPTIPRAELRRAGVGDGARLGLAHRIRGDAVLCAVLCAFADPPLLEATPHETLSPQELHALRQRNLSCARCSLPDRNDCGARGLGRSVRRSIDPGKGEGRCAHTSQLRRGSPRSLY